MNSRASFIAATLFTLLMSTAGGLEAADAVTLETRIYVLKGTDAHDFEVPGSASLENAGSVTFRSPAVARFGSETVSLNGGHFSWSGGENPPDRFDQIQTPDVVLANGTPAELLFTSPVQYMEKGEGGRLQVREIPGDSPEAPHWRLKFALDKGGRTGGDLGLSCDLDVAVVSKRAGIEGVRLDVGKPELARFNERLTLKVPPGEWSAFVVRSPKDGDYTLLTLLRAVPENAADQVAKVGRTMTAEEFAEFATYYYQHPQPDQISRAIVSLRSSGFFGASVRRHPETYVQRGLTTAGFFAEVFASNPDLLPGWRKLVGGDALDRHSKKWMSLALEMGGPGGLLEPSEGKALDPGQLDILWGAFLASGKERYLQRLADTMPLVDDPSTFRAGSKAMLLFASHAPHHPVVHQFLEAAASKAEPRMQKLIDTVLAKDFATVLDFIRENAPERTPPYGQGIEASAYNATGIPLPPPPIPAAPQPSVSTVTQVP